MQIRTFPKFLDQWTSTTSNGFVLNMVKCHHLQLRLFCNTRQFNIKATPLHHLIIQKEVYEQLAKSAIEPSTGRTGFYSKNIIVPKCTCGLHTINNLKQFNHYMHIPTLKMSTIRQIQLLIQQGDYAFSIDLKDAYLHIPIVKHHHHSLWFIWQHKLYIDGRFCLLG